MINEFRRPQRRVFGKDITNITLPTDKNQKLHAQKEHSFQLKYIPNVKLFQQKPKTTEPIPTDPINQYKHQILQHMLKLQKKYHHSSNQTVSKNMRQVLIDWMIDVSVSFELKEQTLHLALSYLNHFESITVITKEQYQLSGIACLWIASKYEQIYPPRMANFINVTADTYTLGQLRRMEDKIMGSLQFNLNHITMLSLLQTSIFNTQKELMEIEKKSIAYAKYIMEIIAIEDSFMQRHNPSKLVSTILLVCNSVFKTKLDAKKLQEMKSYSKEEIYECYKEIVEVLRNGKTYGSNAIKRKYQTEQYFKVGKLKIQLKNEEKPLN